MTGNKSFKGRVRARMAKTGESYTAARRHLVPGDAPGEVLAGGGTDAGPEGAGGGRTTGEPVASPYEATVSDDAMAARTGRPRDDWFALLDAWGAAERPHGEIARWLVEEHGVAGWWAQSVTVAYEQARGLRMPGQRRGGDFSVGASKTIAVPAERVTEAFTDDDLRSRWLPDAPFEVRTSRPGRSVTAGWEGRAAISVHLTAVDPARTRVSLQHGKLPDAASAAEMKAYWRERVAELKRILEG
ncbi:DUF4287 domain-containing protein [Planomonospora corallina]|uniref:DUF4287 domain-containing protein n=1 Tax=Planomonospora corallina TaxID=1806052 RepID=A0ABV8I2X0_9ACTN